MLFLVCVHGNFQVFFKNLVKCSYSIVNFCLIVRLFKVFIYLHQIFYILVLIKVSFLHLLSNLASRLFFILLYLCCLTDAFYIIQPFILYLIFIQNNGKIACYSCSLEKILFFMMFSNRINHLVHISINFVVFHPLFIINWYWLWVFV